MKIIFKSHFIALLVLVSCAEAENKSNNSSVLPMFDHQTTQDCLSLTIDYSNIYRDSTIHFRGLFYADDFVIGGTKGNITSFKMGYLQNNKFKGYQPISSIEGLEETDLRDVHVLTDWSMLVMGITNPAVILKSTPGKEWIKVFDSKDSLTFLDGMDFWNDSIGLVYGDPLNGYHFILKTTDGGDTWNRISPEKIPKNLPIEAGFAASGTGIVCKENGTAFIGLGGEKTRVLMTHDYGESWFVVETPMLHGSEGKGIYSMAFKDAKNGIAVGGNWENTECDSSKIYTNDGGLTWHLSTGLQHYRSCVTYIENDIYVSTGTTGTDITYNGGKTWILLDSTGFNAIQFDEHLKGVAVGSFGTICEVELK